MAQWNDVKSSFCLQSLAHAMAMYDMYVFDCLWLSFHQLSFSHHSCITDFNWQIQGTDDLNHFTCMLHQMVRSSVRSPARLILYSSCTHPILLFFAENSYCTHLHLKSSSTFVVLSELKLPRPDRTTPLRRRPTAAPASCGSGAARGELHLSSGTKQTKQSGTKICRLLCWFVDLLICVVALDQF